MFLLSGYASFNSMFTKCTTKIKFVSFKYVFTGNFYIYGDLIVYKCQVVPANN